MMIILFEARKVAVFLLERLGRARAKLDEK